MNSHANAKGIYFDNNATTPLDPKVFSAMEPYLKEKFGNPASSSHGFGWEATQAMDQAKDQISELIGCDSKEIFWTSGATESNNLALIGLCRHLLKNQKPVHMITSTVEHKAVLEVAEYLETQGVEVTYLRPNKFGQVDLESVNQAIKPHTKIMSFMFANNEIGSVNPIEELGLIAKKNDIFFHVDAAQAAGKLPIDVKAQNIDLLSISAHKLYGPKGTGVLYKNSEKETLKLEPLFFGGAQEGGLRPGTPNVAGAVGLGQSCEICQHELQAGPTKYTDLRDYFLDQIKSFAPKTQLNGHPKQRLPSHLSLTFYDVMPFELTSVLMGVAYSSTSACSSASTSVSYVLKNLGLSDLEARTTLRFGLGRFTKKPEVDIILKRLQGLYASKKSEFKENSL